MIAEAIHTYESIIIYLSLNVKYDSTYLLVGINKEKPWLLKNTPGKSNHDRNMIHEREAKIFISHSYCTIPLGSCKEH